jgi:hypothetical protein
MTIFNLLHPLSISRYRKRSPDPVYLDVWLVDFFAEPTSTNNDVCCLFVLQERTEFTLL